MSRKRSPSEPSGGGEGNWMNTYGDLVTLLLTFFVLLYSFSTVDAAKWEALVKSFSGSHGILSSGRESGSSPLPSSPIDVPVPNGPADQSPSICPTITPQPETTTSTSLSESLVPPKASPTKLPTKSPTKSPTKPPAKTPSPTPDPGLNQLFCELEEFLQHTPIASGLEIVDQDSEILVRLVASVIFEPGSDQLKPEAQTALDGAASILRKYLPLITNLRTEGHTDNVTPPEGDIGSKWELAARRAAIVLDNLVDSCQIDSSKAYSVGFGSARPIASDTTTEGQDLNNRVDIILTH